MGILNLLKREKQEAESISKSKEKMFRERLAMETQIGTPSIFNDMDRNVVECLKEQLEDLKSAISQEEYDLWRETFLANEYEKVKGKPFVAIDYQFAGIGGYTAILPRKAQKSFESWVKSCGSGFLGYATEATREQVESYIALHAAD